ncbi:hypothetical protein TWF569_007371 [Orbilia oligospora]|uniref:CBM1 domain-containing protein n=1 Tax=Orbilia oligospora TaxID=2813651 RepID=A0A7C8JSG3_ORBOL|nr:hypothetical protein TWF706_006324 [Orbilia oligospora]KAF3111581.1 hypothetical protein TWF103_003525 [Orbilia oligospora]KAF3136142.1 hypothetical protein TWF703_005787 [Orbilia oligospora]KAF3143282.1 hypothetical protein TWF569_007371 [Orbilia oligospora]
MGYSKKFVAALLLAPAALAQAPLYGQCGGQGWTGPTTCVSGSTCVYSNDWYSQCLPGAAVTTTAATRTTTASSAATTTSSSSNSNCQAAAHGFASLNGGTTGGNGGTVVVVNNWADLKKYATSSGKYVIKVSGKIVASPTGEEIKVANDKTIVGIGSTGEIYGGGFGLMNVKNIIIRNLKIGNTYDGDWEGKTHDWDGIQSDTSSNIWVDHCIFERGADGLIDLRLDSNYITISHVTFRNHNKVLGIGWTDNVITQATIHHCYFQNVGQRNPSADNLKYAHMYNNYLNNATSYGHYSRGKTNMRVENCYFEKVRNPLQRDDTAVLVASGNTYVSCTGSTAANSGTAFNPSSFYSYTLDSTANVPNIVKSEAQPKASICPS